MLTQGIVLRTWYKGKMLSLFEICIGCEEVQIRAESFLNACK